MYGFWYSGPQHCQVHGPQPLWKYSFRLRSIYSLAYWIHNSTNKTFIRSKLMKYPCNNLKKIMNCGFMSEKQWRELLESNAFSLKNDDIYHIDPIKVQRVLQQHSTATIRYSFLWIIVFLNLNFVNIFLGDHCVQTEFEYPPRGVRWTVDCSRNNV